MTSSRVTNRSGEWAVARAVEEDLNTQRKLIAELMHSSVLADGDIARALQQVTEVASSALRVARASVWRLCDDGHELSLECVDLFERPTRAHVSGAVLRASDLPAYFDALRTERTVTANDACTDPRTHELASYLRPLGIGALLDAPVFVRGKMAAVVCHEHVGPAREWHFWEELIAGTCADFVALVLDAQGWAAAERTLREERDALERIVAERTADLRASEAGLRALLDVSPAPLVLTRSADATVAFANPRACALFDIPSPAPPGTDARAFWVDLDDRERLHEGTASIEVRMRSRTGRVFWARVAAQSVRFDGEEMRLHSVEDITSHKIVEQGLRELAAKDGLTGIHNRRSLIDLGVTEQERSRRYARPLSVAMIDIDHFKRVNDTHGHAAGDDILRGVVGTTTEILRAHDVMGRWGGEEFVVLLPEADLNAATRVLERVRIAVAEKTYASGDVSLHVTISIGVAEWTGIESFEHVVERADQACYKAKHAGRNRVEEALPA